MKPVKIKIRKKIGYEETNERGILVFTRAKEDMVITGNDHWIRGNQLTLRKDNKHFVFSTDHIDIEEVTQ